MPKQFAPLTRSLSLVALVTSVGLAGACGSKDVPPPPPADTGKHVDAATAGSLTGRIAYAGTLPAVETVRMNTDPVCAQTAGPTAPSDAVVVSATGGVANAFVYVKSGLDPSYSFEVPTAPVTLDQKACRYTPHVVGVRVGQPFSINNSDATLHNVHAMPMVNQEFNQGQPIQNVPLLKTFTAPEVMVRFVCNVHGWMRAYVGVMSSPFFAVTDADGAFQIPGLPPGTYTIGVWHETFGAQEQQVTIAEKQAANLSVTYPSK
jgi:plastocyanin